MTWQALNRLGLRLINLKYQLNLFFLALSFFSRIPVPSTLAYSPKLLNQSGRYFSFIGLIIASILSVLFWLFTPTLPNHISVLLIIIASLLLTGAFHEDGLADMADGIGGGQTLEQRLSIMKDSRLGTYGTVTLVSALALKYALLLEIANNGQFVVCLLIGYALSRSVSASLIYSMDYVSDPDTSKSKPLARKQTLFELFIVVIVGLSTLALLPLYTAFIVIFILIVFRQLFAHWLKSRIGGYTGDCLGAAQQLSELIIYLVIVSASSGVPL